MGNRFKNYLFCILLLIITVFSFLAFFIIDITLFQAKKTIFTAFYSYALFPMFSLIYGRFSYQKTKKVVFPNILYFLFCMTFIIIFINIGASYVSTSTSAVLQQSKLAVGVIGVITAVSIIISSLMSIMTSIIIKSVNRKTKTD